MKNAMVKLLVAGEWMGRNRRESEHQPNGRYDSQNDEGEVWLAAASTGGTASSYRGLGRRSARSR